MAQRTVLITGANRGLGLEFARQLSAAGNRVIAAVREPGRAPEALRATGARIEPLDIANPDSIRALAARLNPEGPIDLLINNAGVIGEDPSVGELSFQTFERVFATNVYGPAVLAQAILPALKNGRGRAIWNISSELGSIAAATPGFSYAYNASKAALNMITARLAKDLAADGFTVISFCPGWNRTDMGGSAAPLDPADSIAKLIATGNRLGPADSGGYLRIDGTRIPW